MQSRGTREHLGAPRSSAFATSTLVFGHYAMGVLAFVHVREGHTAAAFLVVQAAACLVLSRRRPPPPLLLGIGGVSAALGTLPAAPVPVAVVLTAIGCAMASLALVDALGARRDLVTATLRCQSLVAAGNGTAPLVWVFLGHDRALLLASLAALGLVAAAASGALRDLALGGAPASRGAGRTAALSGLAVGIQIVLVGALPAVLDGRVVTAVSVGAATGIILGRLAASALPRAHGPTGLRGLLVLAGLCLTPLAAPLHPLVAGPLAFVASAAISPLFPLALAASYPGTARARARMRTEPSGTRRVPNEAGTVLATTSLVAAAAPLLVATLASANVIAAIGVALVGLVIIGVLLSRDPPSSPKESLL